MMGVLPIKGFFIIVGFKHLPGGRCFFYADCFEKFNVYYFIFYIYEVGYVNDRQEKAAENGVFCFAIERSA
jgi:hypothetical protein